MRVRRRSGRVAYALMWAVVAVCIAAFAWLLHLSGEGELEDSMLTVWTSVLSIVMTTCLLVYASVYLTKGSSDRYMEMFHDDADRARRP